MKHTFLLTFLLVALSHFSNGQQPVSDPSGSWQLLTNYSDEFNGTTLDNTLWDNNINSWGAWSWDQQNVYLQNGTMHIRMINEKHVRGLDTFYFKSGAARQKLEITYGYFEARVKGCPKWPGVCPAFWMYSVNQPVTNGVKYNEIDFMEIQQRPYNLRKIDCDLHLERVINGNVERTDPKLEYNAPFDPNDGFHVYGCNVTPTTISMYIDGVFVGSHVNDYYSLPMRVIFSMGLRPPLMVYVNGVKTPIPIENEPGFPTEMEVDYVRVWASNPQTVDNFSTPGSFSWVCPAGVTSVQVQSWGAGGAGGANSSGGTAQRAGGGGGGGSYVVNTVAVVPGVTYTVTVGAGGVWSGTVTNFLSYGPLGGKSEFSGGAVTTITASGGTGGGGGNTASLSGSGGVLGGLYGFTVTTAGINYTTGTTTIDLTGGGGSGATTAFVVASGGINTIATLNQGSGYTSAPTVTINSSNTPTAGSGAAATALVNLNLNAGGTPTTGANGVAGVAGASGSGGAGGNGAGPGGGVGGASNAAGATGGPGLAGAAPGGGGSGGFQGSSNTNSRYGGAGGTGKVTLTYAASAINYYYKGAGALSDVANWGTNTNGTGTAPLNFTNNLQYFNIRNTTAVSTTAQWSVTAITSKIIVGDPTLPAVALTIAPGMYIKGHVDIPAASSGSNAVTVSDTVPTFGTLHPSSQVHLNGKITIDNPYTFGHLLVDGVADTITLSASPITIKTSLVTAAGSLLIGNSNNVNYVDVSGAAVTINGIFRTARTGGISSENISLAGNAAYGLFQFSDADNITLGAGSIIEYNKASSVNAQMITPRNYANLTLSGADNNKQFVGATAISGTLKTNMSGTSNVTGFNQVSFANNATIVRAEDAGAQDAAPTFGTSVNVSYTGTTAQQTSFELPSAAGVLNNLTISNAAGVTVTSATSVKGVFALTSGAAATLSAALNILGGATPGSLTVATGATLTTGGILTLKSDANGTAMVASSAGTISGNATVERFIPAGKRSYRQLSSGVNSTGTIRANWQNGGSLIAGVGMHITGSVTGANGFDASPGGNANMFTYTPGSPSFTAIPSTDATNLKALRGYRVFINGDRNANLTVENTTSGPGSANIALNSNVTLKASGTLVTGTVTYNTTGATANGSTDNAITLGSSVNDFALIANPYWSPVSWDQFINKTDITNTYWIWDPIIGNRGAYTSYTHPSGSSGGGSITKDIQPGQAIFIRNNASLTSGASITFEEANKSSGFTNTFRSATQSPSKMRIYLYTNTALANNGPMQDGATVAFRDDFNAAIGNEDAAKFTNTDENIAIVRGNSVLGLEARPTVTAADTIPIRIWKLYSNNQYTLKLDGMDFDAGITGILVDKKLNQEHVLNLGGNITLPFTYTASDSSSYYDRFMLVFRPSTPLPVNFTNIKAFTKNAGIQVEWNVAAEVDVIIYEVEKSGNGTSFEKSGTVTASNSKAYNWFDALQNNGNNYYRIKVINKDNSSSYSNVVNVKMGSTKGDIVSVYPNPIKGNVLNVQFNNLEKGTYTVQLFNQSGQQMFTQTVTTEGGYMNQKMPLDKLAVGVYSMVITGTQGIISTQKIIKEN